jgi:dTDP-glucose 4,6-dehydratase
VAEHRLSAGKNFFVTFGESLRIVVTGGAGFLGSHLCEKLLGLGHSVLCIDNLATGSRKNIEHLEANAAFQFRLQDVTQYLDVEGPVDAIAHLASPASPPDYLRLQIQTLKVGSLGTHKALGLARAKGARFLLASTSEVYGDPLVNPQPETYWGNVNPVGPRGVYDEAKRFAEAITLAYHRCHGVDVRIARIFNTYGPRMRPSDGRVVSNFIVQALRGEPLTVYGDGSQTRSLCYVSDLVEGLTRLLLADSSGTSANHPIVSSLERRGAAGGEVGESATATEPSENGDLDGIHGPVNLGNPVEMKVIDIARTIIRLTGSKSTIAHLPLPADDPKVRCPAIARAETLLGWTPKVELEEGLGKTLRHFGAIMKLPHGL